MTAANIFAQIPKRFFFRNRPWQAGHALKFTSASTSSFPSRACYCATSYMLSMLLGLYKANYTSAWNGYVAAYFLTIVPAIMTACSRIYLGAHYLSDCVIGVLYALAICTTIFLLYYTTGLFSKIEFQDTSLLGVILVGVFSFILNILINLKSFSFWEKGAPIFGALAGNL
jgi:membrane-associated phospholipid phosphatase